jgi:uncharacterized protein YggU (UPF0235/DUF167 family)
MHIKVRVKTGAKNESVKKISGDHYELSVREKPEANMANKRVLVLMARTLKIPVERIRITKGHHSPSKILTYLDKAEA